MIPITHRISIQEDEIGTTYVRSSGPGGQNVNKVATAVQLRFDVMRSPSLPAEVKERLVRLAGSRMTNDGVLVIQARQHRTQGANRAAALERLVELIRKATVVPRPRLPTRPTYASKLRRLETKHRRAKTKELRRRPNDE